ncbi:hypothetical protein P8452_40547 [Trifolium repens]|nr:hypothetical protein P8452_40547 [Trifolium repens]
MPPHSEIATSFNRFLAGKLSSLSESEISLLADDALTNLVEFELSRLSQDDFNRLAEAELSPFLPFVEGVFQALFAEIFPKPKPKPKEEEQTSHPVTLDGIIVLTLATISSFVVIKRCVRNFCQWLDIRLKYLKGDFTVTTITPQPQQGELIPSNSPLYSSKYSRTAGVQGFKGIRHLQKAKTVFLHTESRAAYQDQEGTSRAVVRSSRSTETS